METQRTSYINARIEPRLKASVSKTLKKVGMTTSDAITLFFHQVELHKGLPFDVRIPNAETLQAVKEMRTPALRKNLPVAASPEEMFEQILGKDWKKYL